MHTMHAKHDYEVVVGNIGTTYQGKSFRKAINVYDGYVDQSKNLPGARCYHEDVTLMRDGEPILEWIGGTTQYTVSVRVKGTYTAEVQATSAGEAREKALAWLDNVTEGTVDDGEWSLDLMRSELQVKEVTDDKDVTSEAIGI